MLEREKMTECLCLALILASWSGIYRSSMRKRGTDDGIVEICNRSNFWKNRLLMVSKVVSVRNGVLDLWGVYHVLERKKKKKRLKKE